MALKIGPDFARRALIGHSEYYAAELRLIERLGGDSLAAESRLAEIQRTGSLVSRNPGGLVYATDAQYNFGSIAQSNLAIGTRGARIAGYVELSPQQAERFELDRQLSQLPAESFKHDPAVADDFLAQWILNLPNSRRGQFLRDLVIWLKDHDHAWHDDAALEIATRVRDERLINEAVEEAERLGTGGDAVQPDGRMAAWLKFQLRVIASIYLLPTPRGRAYLRAMRRLCATTSKHTERELCLRAWITLCAISNSADEGSCVSEVIDQVRRWDDHRLKRSVFGLIGSYYGNEKLALIRDVLTAEELALAAP